MTARIALIVLGLVVIAGTWIPAEYATPIGIVWGVIGGVAVGVALFVG